MTDNFFGLNEKLIEALKRRGLTDKSKITVKKGGEDKEYYLYFEGDHLSAILSNQQSPFFQNIAAYGDGGLSEENYLRTLDNNSHKVNLLYANWGKFLMHLMIVDKVCESGEVVSIDKADWCPNIIDFDISDANVFEYFYKGEIVPRVEELQEMCGVNDLSEITVQEAFSRRLSFNSGALKARFGKFLDDHNTTMDAFALFFESRMLGFLADNVYYNEANADVANNREVNLSEYVLPLENNINELIYAEFEASAKEFMLLRTESDKQYETYTQFIIPIIEQNEDNAYSLLSNNYNPDLLKYMTDEQREEGNRLFEQLRQTEKKLRQTIAKLIDFGGDIQNHLSKDDPNYLLVSDLVSSLGNYSYHSLDTVVDNEETLDKLMSINVDEDLAFSNSVSSNFYSEDNEEYKINLEIIRDAEEIGVNTDGTNWEVMDEIAKKYSYSVDDPAYPSLYYSLVNKYGFDPIVEAHRRIGE